MTKAQHTPGPWEAYPVQVTGTNALTYQIEAEDNQLGNSARRVATLIRGDFSPNGHLPYNASEEEANARLIAAAPELLEALESFVRWTERHNLNMADLIDGNRCECPVVINARAAIAKAKGE